MKQSDFDGVSGVLRGLLIRVGDRTTNQALTLVSEFIDAGELGLALEWLADDLSEYEQPLTTGLLHE